MTLRRLVFEFRRDGILLHALYCTKGALREKILSYVEWKVIKP